MNRRYGVGLLLAAGLLSGCGDKAEPGISFGDFDLAELDIPTRPITYLCDIKPLIDQDCVSCHGASLAQGGVRLHTLADARTHAAKAVSEVLEGAMPKGSAGLPAAERALWKALFDRWTAANFPEGDAAACGTGGDADAEDAPAEDDRQPVEEADADPEIDAPADNDPVADAEPEAEPEAETEPEADGDPAAPTWAGAIQPLMTAHGCNDCHASRRTYDGVKRTATAMIGRMSSTTRPMPPPTSRYPQTTAEERAVFQAWIDAGFPQ